MAGRRQQIRIKRPLKKLVPYLLQAKEQNMNEADTVRRVTKVLEDALGYDPLVEISREAQLKGKYLDLLIKVDDVARLTVEAKRAGIKLRDRHIDQAYTYASTNNIPWVLLTNGVVWNLYHLTFEEGIEYERAFSVDFSKHDLDAAADKLVLLHRENVRKGGLEDFWECQIALSWPSIAKALFQEDVLRRIRREIRRTAGILIDTEDLSERLREMMSPEVRETIGQVKVRKRTRRRKTTGREDDLCEPESAATTKAQADAGDRPSGPPAKDSSQL